MLTCINVQGRPGRWKGSRPPGLIIIGEVVRLHASLAWLAPGALALAAA